MVSLADLIANGFGELLLASFLEPISVGLEWSLLEDSGGPEIGSQVAVGLLDGIVGGLDEVSEGLGVSFSVGVDILETGVRQDLLGCLGSDNTSTTRSRNQSESDTTTFAGNFDGNGVRSTESVSPISSSNRDDTEFCIRDSALDGSTDFTTALLAETQVAVVIADDNEGLESSTLTSSCLFLNRVDLHDFILESILEEVVNDFRLLDGQGEEVDLF